MKVNLTSEQIAQQKTVYKTADREELRRLIEAGILCSHVQKWIIERNDLEAAEWMSNCSFRLSGCLESYYKDNASLGMRSTYKPF